MTEQFGLQASFNIPSGEQYEKGDMVNIRGSNPEEFHRNLIAFDEQLATIVASVGNTLRKVYMLNKSLDTTQIGHEPHAPQGQEPQGYAQTPQQAPQEPQGQGWGNQPTDYGNGPQNGYQQPQQGYQGQPQGGYQQQGPPQGQQQPPQGGNGIPTEPPPHVGPAPQCSHGVKRFLAKPYKGGKPGYWMAWACPAQQGDQSQHELEFIRNS